MRISELSTLTRPATLSQSVSLRVHLHCHVALLCLAVRAFRNPITWILQTILISSKARAGTFTPAFAISFEHTDLLKIVVTGKEVECRQRVEVLSCAVIFLSF